jgi:YbbR domain-containing protein
MILALLRWLAKNFATLLLAFMLAVVVWVTAVLTQDPNEETTFRPVTLEWIGQGADLLLVSDVPTQARLTLRAPQSVWTLLNNEPSRVKAWADLAGLGPGEHVVPVKVLVDANPIRLIKVDPAEVRLTLEKLVSKDLTIQLAVSGDLPLGYKKGSPQIEPIEVTVSGPESAVQQVVQVRASLDITGMIESFHRSIVLEALDENENPVSNVTITPKTANISQPISLLGGFKNVVVRVVTKGQVANGYRLTNILVSPPTVTLFSDNPQLVDEIPGYVDTLPVDLSNLSDDIEINVGLNLPDGITLVREPSVLVQVSVAAIEGSLTLSLPVEVIGLSPGLTVSISPAVVDGIVAGPLNILDQLSASSFRVVLDLTGLPPGVYQRSPVVDLYPDQVRIQTTLPETLEVTIEEEPTPTPNPTESTTPQAEGTPAATPTP